jgi:bacterioferritin
MALQSNTQVDDAGAPGFAGQRNAVLRNQLTSTNQVFLNAFILEHWGFHLCAERMYVESLKETRRSMRSLRYMTVDGMEPGLGGTPGLYSPVRPVVGRTLDEVFKLERHHAEQSLGVLSTVIAAPEAAKESTLLDFFRQAARGQGEYVAWLTAQSDSFHEMGETVYRETQGAALQDGELKSFLQKVEELQARDRDFPEGTAGGGDRVDSVVLQRINDLLGVEIMSAERTFVDAFLFDRRGDQSLADRIIVDALASMRRAQRITEHILASGEVPAPGAPFDISRPAGQTIQDYLDAEKHLEEAKIAIIHGASSSANPLPSATQSLFAGLLRQYERRAQWLASGGGTASNGEPSMPPGVFRAMLGRWGVPPQ